MKVISNLHVMDAELIEDRATMRYSCPVCERCVEDGPEGLVIVYRGDATAAHRGGSLGEMQQQVEPLADSGRPASMLLH